MQKRRQPSSLWTVEQEKVHARRVVGILVSLQKAGLNEGINGCGDTLHAVSNKGGELFVRQERPGMPLQKHEEIEGTGVADDRSASKQVLGLVHP